MDEIFKRGTCRHFKELTPVAKEDLLTLVKAGMQARACGNQEAREFIIVTRDDLVKAISHNSLVAGPARKAGATNTSSHPKQQNLQKNLSHCVH